MHTKIERCYKVGNKEYTFEFAPFPAAMIEEYKNMKDNVDLLFNTYQTALKTYQDKVNQVNKCPPITRKGKTVSGGVPWSLKQAKNAAEINMNNALTQFTDAENKIKQHPYHEEYQNLSNVGDLTITIDFPELIPAESSPDTFRYLPCNSSDLNSYFNTNNNNYGYILSALYSLNPIDSVLESDYCRICYMKNIYNMCSLMKQIYNNRIAIVNGEVIPKHPMDSINNNYEFMFVKPDEINDIVNTSSAPIDDQRNLLCIYDYTIDLTNNKYKSHIENVIHINNLSTEFLSLRKTKSEGMSVNEKNTHVNKLVSVFRKYFNDIMLSESSTGIYTLADIIKGEPTSAGDYDRVCKKIKLFYDYKYLQYLCKGITKDAYYWIDKPTTSSTGLSSGTVDCIIL